MLEKNKRGKKINSFSSASSFSTTQQGNLQAKYLHVSGRVLPRVFVKIFLQWKQKVLVPGKNYQSLAWVGVGGAPSPRAADSMVTCWSGTSSFACHKIGSSVCTKHIKLWPYTCQECLGHSHLLFPCSPVSVFLLLFSHHFYTDLGEWSLSSVLCRTL